MAVIIGIGTDIIDIERIEKTIERFGMRFLARVFTDEERARAAKSETPGAVYAKRWAAKEACWKALGADSKRGIKWHDFTVTNSLHGAPILTLTGAAAAQLATQAGAGRTGRIHLSLSDERRMVVAFVVISADPVLTENPV
jgi:holo-[acyl-carrier protein] synthase